ncbi:hypothetical protein GGR42_002918 [Saonia flava]|uniref:Uncharacterized protein n=1 Tax=Saonia flava TaxID=523696 RepID=A0A846QYZ9_9FLAO|nr:hypothetical protein [Saonia flava]NJB72427.1 hypothetical protein [Saonia flava]
MKKIIKAFFKEIVPIIVGILVALYINNWNEDRKDKNYINRISTSIQNELTESHDDINIKLVKQNTLIDSLKFYSKDNQISLDKIIKKADGIYIPKIRINSWKAISNSKIELMDYQKVSTLADIEEQKDLLQMKAEKLIDFIYSNYKETGKEKKEFMIIMMSEVISTEKSLQEDIRKIIKE